MWLFKSKPKKIKPTKELQAELKALCNKIIAQQVMYHSDGEQYTKLLKELYMRGVEPITTLKPIL